MKDCRFKISHLRGLAWIAGGLVVIAGLSLPLVAQTPPSPTPTPAVDQFLPMSQAAPREVLPATPLVFYAYAFVWLALIAYVFLMWRRLARVEQDLAAVQRRLDGTGGR